MLLSISFLVPIAAITLAAKIRIDTGKGGLKFSPDSTTAKVGDVLEFHFYGPFHTVVQGDFGTPCQQGSFKSTGFNSGPIKNRADGRGNVFQIKVKNTKPIWYFCGTPSHCQSGMVGVINPPDSGKSLNTYKKKAAGTSSSEISSAVRGGDIVQFPADLVASSVRTRSSDPSTTSSFRPSFGYTSVPGRISPNSTTLPSDFSPSVAASRLITQLRDRVLRDYELYSTFFCFHAGHSLRCEGPWLRGDYWNRDSLKIRAKENTRINPGYQCSMDKTYLGAPGSERVFYGFSGKNVTKSLNGVAHHVSLFAAGSCSLNATCARLYNNNTDRMYADYRHYLSSTFFKYLETELVKNESLSYCPDSIYSTASMFEWMTAHFDSGKEYFGFHNAIFMPGVMAKLNATEQMARIAAKQYFANNARKIEGVLLNMIFFSYKVEDTLTKRSEEIYPGCSRSEWISKGYCEGVIPPRWWDMDGSVISMKDRDREETAKSLSLPNFNAIRQAASDCRQLGSLEGQLALFETAIALYNTVTLAIGLVNYFEGVALAGALAIEAAPLLAALGIVYFGAAAILNACDAFQTCNGVPDGLTGASKILATALASGKIKSFPLVKALKPLAGYTGALPTAFTFLMLKVAQSYFNKAEACCEQNCAGAVCQQAGLGCILMFSSSRKLDCGAM